MGGYSLSPRARRRLAMRASATVFLVLIAISNATGCGTFRNLEDGNCKVYGGVQSDARASLDILPTVAVCCGLRNDSEFEMIPPGICLMLQLFAVVDLPLSIIGDTLTLPVVCRQALRPLPLPASKEKAADTPELLRPSS